MSERIPLVFAAAVRQQVAGVVIRIVVFLVTNRIFAMDELITGVIRIIRADDRIPFADFANPFKKLRLFARRQIDFTVDGIVDSC
ncbi:hypothetical protein [Paenibacillus harenae]|uniref:Uncharacterized protein n=1 Tax=Paenibacillus harenae TaxID=306543 RepID=A0ABT9U4R7_PAEHA|nr:hypothetical protein [Paenibacillus harenae]MDQ0062442.1 hypothetical protein [Paenibacillus harenae]MDQ0114632.1 hypothetical protein [Paenibacillus harenae]